MGDSPVASELGWNQMPRGKPVDSRVPTIQCSSYGSRIESHGRFRSTACWKKEEYNI
jgi:hypothetical protein